jgi:hypothetical protein
MTYCVTFVFCNTINLQCWFCYHEETQNCSYLNKGHQKTRGHYPIQWAVHLDLCSLHIGLRAGHSIQPI